VHGLAWVFPGQTNLDLGTNQGAQVDITIIGKRGAPMPGLLTASYNYMGGT